eukprot:scaffold18552_cov39-Prasinocladus_malaysianus.AAC.1
MPLPGAMGNERVVLHTVSDVGGAVRVPINATIGESNRLAIAGKSLSSPMCLAQCSRRLAIDRVNVEWGA